MKMTEINELSVGNLQPVYIVGATASGKSELAFRLAQITGGTVISADSMQIYRGLDIGTAKESVARRRKVEHKMIDIIDYDSEFSVAEYAELANKEIADCINRGVLPIVAGGTGLYFEALLYPMSFASADKNEEIRRELQAFLQIYGNEALHDRLKEVDAVTADRLHPNDTKRVIRALEVALATGKPMSERTDKREKPDVIMVGIDMERAALYERINARVDKMFDDGLVSEVASINDFTLQSMQAIGYKEFDGVDFIRTPDGSVSLAPEDENRVKELIKKHTRNYAKRQLTWFRRYPFAVWFKNTEDAISYILGKLNTDIRSAANK